MDTIIKLEMQAVKTAFELFDSTVFNFGFGYLIEDDDNEICLSISFEKQPVTINYLSALCDFIKIAKHSFNAYASFNDYNVFRIFWKKTLAVGK